MCFFFYLFHPLPPHRSSADFVIYPIFFFFLTYVSSILASSSSCSRVTNIIIYTNHNASTLCTLYYMGTFLLHEFHVLSGRSYFITYNTRLAMSLSIQYFNTSMCVNLLVFFFFVNDSHALFIVKSGNLGLNYSDNCYSRGFTFCLYLWSTSQ